MVKALVESNSSKRGMGDKVRAKYDTTGAQIRLAGCQNAARTPPDAAMCDIGGFRCFRMESKASAPSFATQETLERRQCEVLIVGSLKQLSKPHATFQ